MYECEKLFGLARGIEIQNVVEEALDRPCPCKVGERCILEVLPHLAEAG